MSLTLKDTDTQPVTFGTAPVLDAAGNPDTTGKIAFTNDNAAAFPGTDNGDGTYTGAIAQPAVLGVVHLETTVTDTDGVVSPAGPAFEIDIIGGDAVAGPAISVTSNPNAPAPVA